MEEWRPIPDWPVYEVSNLGRIRSIDRTDRLGRQHQGTIRKLFPNTLGTYMRVELGGGNNTRHRGFDVHSLVALAFLGPPPSGMTVSHLNGNGFDNRLSNLIYETRKANHQRKHEHGTMPTGSKHWVNRLGVVRESNGRFARQGRRQIEL